MLSFLRRLLVVIAGLVPQHGEPPASARACSASEYTQRQALPAIDVLAVKRMSCRRGVEVMRRVAPALSPDYYDRLGHTRNRIIGAYTCSGYLVGDGAWRIVCRSEDRSVYGYTAE